MAHARNDSLGSVSSLTSISSRTSVETYESLKEEIIKIEKSDVKTLHWRPGLNDRDIFRQMPVQGLYKVTIGAQFGFRQGKT